MLPGSVVTELAPGNQFGGSGSHSGNPAASGIGKMTAGAASVVPGSGANGMPPGTAVTRSAPGNQPGGSSGARYGAASGAGGMMTAGA